jgi:hypothetical protein
MASPNPQRRTPPPLRRAQNPANPADHDADPGTRREHTQRGRPPLGRKPCQHVPGGVVDHHEQEKQNKHQARRRPPAGITQADIHVDSWHVTQEAGPTHDTPTRRARLPSLCSNPRRPARPTPHLRLDLLDQRVLVLAHVVL